VPRYLHAAHQDAGQRYQAIAAQILGNDVGNVVEDPAWGAVVRRLYDAEHDGWDPFLLLDAAVRMRELETADSIAEVLSWRIDAYLDEHSEPPAPGRPYESRASQRERLTAVITTALGPSRTARAQTETAWPALIAALEHVEDNGHDAARALHRAVSVRELRTARSISETLAWRINRQQPDAVPAPARSATAAILPWVPAPCLSSDHGMDRYQREAADLITARISDLTELTLSDKPAWMNLLGQPPQDLDQRAEWTRHIAVVAAYRDQHKIITDDPRQVLGAYWHASRSILDARHLVGLDQAPPHDDARRAWLATAVYRGLAEDERASIAADLASRLGPLWLGHPAEPDEHAAAQDCYSDELTTVLTEHGHLSRHATSRTRSRNDREEPIETNLARLRCPGRPVPADHEIDVRAPSSRPRNLPWTGMSSYRVADSAITSREYGPR
jgi:hypothetical protein